MSSGLNAARNSLPSADQEPAPVIYGSNFRGLIRERNEGWVAVMRNKILLLAAAALAITPAAAQQLRYLSPQDVAEAQRQHAELVQELGGAETGPRAAYVQTVGARIGAYSGLANPGQTLRFTTLNSAVENALS